MKYLIFGNNKKANFTANIKNNLNTRLYDIEESMELFCDLAAKKKYKYLYLIADFETYESKYFEAVNAYDDKYYRFLTIAFCNTENKYDMENIIVKDRLALLLKGFTHVFKDNFAAIDKFQYYIDTKLKCNMVIKKECNSQFMKDIPVASSTNIINHGNKHIRLYSLKEPSK